MTSGLALFDTAIGRCGVAWGVHGLRAVQLPGTRDDLTRAALRRKVPQAQEAAPPAEVQRACAAMTRLLEGEPVDLDFVALDMDGVPEFNRSVYAIARTIPPGETRTYGDIATVLGDKLLSRAVGKALGENPFPIVVPCHRVVAANRRTGGFSAPGGVATKFRMLAIERARIAPDNDMPLLFEPELSVAPRRS